MKNRNQVRQNRSAARPSPQVKKAKKSALKSKAETAPAKIECAGHWIEGNIWFKLGVSKTEAKMLKVIAGELFTKKHGVGGSRARFVAGGARPL
jgi:hypothetical protein